MRTKGRIERDLALLNDADERHLRMTGIELFWSGFPEKQIDMLFHADGGARLWADDDLHEAFSVELRKLIRVFLHKDLDHCHQELARLGVEIDEH